MESSDYTSLILYYGRARFYHSMQKVALDGLAKFPAQTAFRLFNGIALALGNRVQEGIRELNPLKNDVELGPAAMLAVIHAHKCCSIVDKDALVSLNQRLKDERNALSANGAYYAAVFLYLTGSLESSREYVSKTLKLEGEHEFAVVLRAWIEMSHNAAANANVLRSLEGVLTRGKHIDASLAQVRYFQLRGQLDNAISVLNKLSVRFPELNIPLVEKMNTQLAAFYWDHALETAQRIVNLEPSNVMALRVKTMLLVGREGNFKAGVATLHQLLGASERIEIGNYDLVLEICQLFSRICSRNREVLAVTSRFVDKVVQLNPTSVEFCTERGYQRLMLGDTKEAIGSFRAATKLDDKYFYALCGLTIAELLQNSAVEQKVEQQIEFLNELRGIEQDPLLLFLRAKVTDQSGDAVKMLIDATESQLQKVESLTFGPEYLRLFNPDFMLQIALELLRHSPKQIHLIHSSSNLGLSQESTHITLKHCLSVLQAVLRACPSHLQAIFLRAKVELLCGDIAVAAATLNHILADIDATYTDGHLLLAHIFIRMQQFAKAMQSLEMALSHDFAVRDNPMYHLLLGIIQKNQQQLNEAQKTFFTAMQLLGYPHGISADQQQLRLRAPDCKPAAAFSSYGFTTADKVTLFLELISTFKEMGDAQCSFESERLLQCAMEEFRGTTEEGRLVIAQAEFMLQNCNVSKAINLLAAIRPGQSYYIQAKTQLAHIHLQHRKDRVAFAKCFKELVDTCSEPESYLMLGEAYMSIQEPDLAVDAYQKALSMNPNDPLLASKLGRAYVKTHQYVRAIKYYKEALKNPDHTGLKLDLAELYLKLKQYSNASDTLNNGGEQSKINDQDIAVLQLRTKELLLLARIHERAGDISLSLQTLRDACDNQYRVQKRISVDQSGNLHEQYKVLSKICLLMAQQSVQLRDNEQALKCFKESLKYTPDDIEILSSLARLYMHMNSTELCRDVCMQILQIDSNNEAASVMMADLSFRKQSVQLRDNEQALKCFKESLKYTPDDIEILSSLARLYMHMNSTELCRDVCMQILQIDSNNEAASVMMADLSFRKMEFENAAYHFSQLLISQPCYWTALARLIEVMRRSGTMSEATSFLQRAEQAATNPQHNSGLNYCKGLFEWYSGNPNGALRHFNVARRDYEWGQQAIFNMIDICINPDGDIPNSADMQDAIDSGEFSDSRAIALRTAERLLKELRPRPGGMDNEVLNHRLLQNFLQLATKQKFQVESALQYFTDLATREEYQNMVGPVLGMASALVHLKQVQRAKNQLKRIARVPWNFEEAEYLERSWLLLADIYIQSNKFDVAAGFVERVLEYNKSSVKAHELAGYIAEKTQMYRDAVKHYYNAWNCGGHSKPHIGYKLAYNYMKTKRYADAIEVCQKVTKLHPDYTIIRKDIMDKCRSNLRS